ncbi:MAG: hypothetical protein ABIN89_22910 [Chitinophagaceae bacterium]
MTSAGHFRKGKLPVVVRFSDFTGIPDISDANGLANPRGFAIKFKLPDSSSTDIVGHSFNGFPTATSDDFRELLLAIATSGPEATKPTNLDKFLGSHPIAKTFLTTQNPAPVNKDPAPANTKTFILVHGAWPASWVWKDVKTQLESQGQKVMVVELPAHGV